MTFSPEQVASLKADLNRSHVAQREQAGRKLSYIEAWWAIAEANRIFGFDAWNRETVELRLLGEPRLVGDKYRVGYMAKVRIKVYSPLAEGGLDYVTREGCGFGSGIDKDVDQAHESALKEAESDAMKRALMTFGNPFGLALYDKTQANVSDGSKPAPANEPYIETRGRKSSAQATRDGDHTAYIAKIDACKTPADVDEMEARFDEDTAAMPRSWLDPFRDKLILRREDLTAPVVEGEAEFDEAFRQTMAEPRSGAMAGRNGAVAA